MNHPYEQLADLVDGTLDEETLAGVQAHLRACASCREDLANARAGREAARSLPQEPPPADLRERVLREAGGGRGRAAPAWYRWAGAAAAAALVIVIALALPDVGDEPADMRAGGAATNEAAEDSAVGAQSTGGVVFSIQDRDYDETALRDLARTAGDRATLDAAAPAEVARDGSAAAERCVNQAWDDVPVGRLARLIEARYRGREAFIALYLEGPGAGQPPDTAAVWVAAEDDCTPLTFATARLSG
jgi:hypothetical protein